MSSPPNKPAALVTGGSRGIGLGIAQKLAADGFNVAINGRREQSEVQDAIESIEQQGATVCYCQADVGDKASRDRMLEQVDSSLGRLDVLVNNAGVAPQERLDILEATEESFERLMHINLQGPYFLTQAAANWMIKQKETIDGFRGIIVNVGSMSATVASTNRGEYCVSKAGLAMATQLFAARLGEFGIDCFEVRPGITQTDMTSGVKQKYDKLIAEGLTVDRRWGQPEDIANAVGVCARGELTYATGQVLVVDGGLTLQRL